MEELCLRHYQRRTKDRCRLRPFFVNMTLIVSWRIAILTLDCSDEPFPSPTGFPSKLRFLYSSTLCALNGQAITLANSDGGQNSPMARF